MKYNDPGSFLTIGHLNPDRCVDRIEYTYNVRFRLHSDIYLIVGTYCRNGILFLFGVTFQDVSGPNKNIEMSLPVVCKDHQIVCEHYRPQGRRPLLKLLLLPCIIPRHLVYHKKAYEVLILKKYIFCINYVN